MEQTPLAAVPPVPPSHRPEQLNSLVQQEVAGILKRELEFPPGSLVTVTKAKVAPDATSARISISVLPGERGPAVLAMINAHIREVQRVLNKRLVMEFVPKLIFRLDTQEEKASDITAVLDTLTDEDLGES